MKKVILILGLLVVGNFLLTACGGKETSIQKKSEETPKAKIQVNKSDKQLNITFFLDLSDRIELSKYPATPEHFERDMSVVNEFVGFFRTEMQRKGGFMAKGKMKVLFRPAPQDPDINQIAESLDIDLSGVQVAQKKKVFDNIEQDFTGNLKKIYDKTLESKNYIGSDIWHFFKNDAKLLAVDTDPNYRNILVVITDGYLYHKDSKMKEKNRFSYILPKMSKEYGLTKSDWKAKMDKLDYGLIAPRHDLDNLEVLFLELNPSTKVSPYEEDVLKTILSKWLTEMGVKKFEVYNSDIPQTTKKRIEKFMK